jgi:ankyrin repeat protein
MIEKLLSLGCDPMMPDNLGRTPLHYVCEKGLPSACSLLISKGVAVNALDYGVIVRIINFLR